MWLKALIRANILYIYICLFTDHPLSSTRMRCHNYKSVLTTALMYSIILMKNTSSCNADIKSLTTSCGGSQKHVLPFSKYQHFIWLLHKPVMCGYVLSGLPI